MASGGFMDDLFSDSFGGFTPKKPPEEKGVVWHAKQIDGKLYLPMEEVILLLERNDVLPKMQAALGRYIAD